MGMSKPGKGVSFERAEGFSRRSLEKEERVEGCVAEEGGGERPTRDTGGRGAWSEERTKGLLALRRKGRSG